MRAFIALPLPDTVKKEIEKIQSELKVLPLDAKWVGPRLLHLTFKFLGDIGEEQIPGITQTIEETGKKFPRFEVALGEFGFFPNSRNPRVFFVATDHDEQLRAIAFWLEDELEKIGFPKERKFKSHITLARFRSVKNIVQLQMNIPAIPPQLTFPADRLVLYKSTLTPHGPIYEEISSVNLK
ncbi:MAG: RNA 2',3'-cyclic phosphodiesterase [Candidatus Omnitrophica bacterium]|nr:RNA 2',3'-cyclic phosphodiesterase [Candidatus Omnitrophota bacterium]